MKPVDSVSIDLDRPRTMRLDMLALFHAEQKINKLRGNPKPLSIFGLLNKEVIAAEGSELGIPVDLMLVLFWASLLHEDPALTFEQAGRLAGNPIPIMAKVMETLSLCVLAKAVEQAEMEAVEVPLAPPNGVPPSHSDVSN